MRIAAALGACAAAAVVAAGIARAVEPVEPPPPTADIVVGTSSLAPHVKVFDGASLGLLSSFFAFPGFPGGVDVAAGDVTGDGVADLVVGAGPGAPGGHVKVFDGLTGAERASFFSFVGFAGGVHVAAGDVNGDGRADIVVGTSSLAPHVKVFDGSSFDLLASFFAFPGFPGGVDVAAGDVNGDGRADLVVGAGPGAPGGHVKVIDGATFLDRASFFSFAGFTGGVNVAAGDVNGDGNSDVIVGAGAGAPGGHVKVFDGSTLALLQSFFAFPGFTGGADVAAGDVDGDGRADLVVGAGAGAPGGHVKVFDGASSALRASFFSFESFVGGIRVAARPGARAAGDPDPHPEPDAGVVAELVRDLPQEAFAAKGHSKASLARLAGIEALILAGDVDEAIAELEGLRKRLDGCPATATSSEAADRNDWIVDCDAQRAVRAAIDGVLAALGSG